MKNVKAMRKLLLQRAKKYITEKNAREGCGICSGLWNAGWLEYSSRYTRNELDNQITFLTNEISQRLGNSVFLNGWLDRVHGIKRKNTENYYEKLLATRLAWIESLIEEFGT